MPPLVDIVTQSPGQSAEEIERYITIPIEVQMAGIPACHGGPHDLALRPVRHQLQFTYDFTYDRPSNG